MSEQLVSGGPATRALAHIWDSWSKYAPLIGTIKHIGITTIPDDWVPWLIWDQGLEDIVPYVRDMRQALAEGPAWLRTRGTPAGISTGISFVQSAGIVASSDQRHAWWEFQVGFDQPPSDIAQIQQLDGIIRLSKASEDELFRMFSPGADFRPVRMDMHRMDDGLMDAYSGVRLWDGGPLISFGWANSIATDFGTSSIESVEVTVSINLNWFDGMRMDVDRMGTRPESLTAYAAELDVSTETYAWAADSWPVVWPTDWAAAAEPATLNTSWEIL